MINDDSLKEWYMKGFHDELHNTLTNGSEKALENHAYMIGSTDAYFGEGVTSVVYPPWEKTLLYIKESFNEK